jgi:glutamine amidotransferase
MKIISVVDYGMGNLFSVFRAIEYCGAKPILVSQPKDILNSRALILPGVGAFSNGMAGLQARNLIAPLLEYATSGRYLLGICLGMQMLLDESDEFGTHKGLGIIPGKVKPILPVDIINNRPHKVPHIGWKALIKPAHLSSWNHSILHETTNSEKVYFVHSYTVVPDDENHRLADCYYNGQKISAMIQHKNILGCQFHPEKSGKSGLKIVKNFVDLL